MEQLVLIIHSVLVSFSLLWGIMLGFTVFSLHQIHHICKAGDLNMFPEYSR